MNDFEVFKNRVINLMGHHPQIKDIITVFYWYFQDYILFMGKPHPNLKDDQIVRIASEMFDESGSMFDVEDYDLMIRKHFLTHYRNCDYNINHFFSGKVRLYRYYEIGGGYIE